jgi:16S rRNA (cytidine1402-2'-O)-methyltransferase
VLSGFRFERYQFLGYLPRGEKALRSLWEELARWPHAAVAFESPQRLPLALRTLADAHPERPVAVCRELTKAFEEVVRGPARDVAERFPEAPKGEITLVVGPGGVETGQLDDVRTAADVVAELVAEGLPRKRAVELVGRVAGVSRNALYRRSL